MQGSLSTKKDSEKAATFKSLSKSQKIYSRGKPPPKNGNDNAWMNSVITSPEPLTIYLESLDSLSPLKNYLKKKPEVMSNIKKAIQDYCEELHHEGAVSSCKPLGPDPPFPYGKNS